ncbi:MAG: glycosyltransferase [Acidimicrobiales bacterium]
MTGRHRPAGVQSPEAASGELWDSAAPSLELSIVVPFYNPGPRLRANVERLLEVLGAAGVGFEVIAVSDGSTDGSAETLEGLGGGSLRRVTLADNGGKGQALRVGLAMGRGAWLGFIDADGDLSPELLGPFVSLMRAYAPDIMLGSKRHPMSDVHYPPLRRAYSWGYQQLIRALFRLRVRDTQTGLKLVRREVLAAVLPRMVEKRFAFDLELFVVARHLGYDRLFEVPVRIEERFSSTISARAVGRIFLDTLAIWYRLHLRRHYGPPG